VRRVHDHALQALFPVATGWGLALSFARPLDRLSAWTPVPEGHPLHGFLITNLPPAIVILACAALMLAVYRRWPLFLRVPDAASWPRLVLGAAVCTLITIPLLMIVCGLAGVLLETEPADRTNPQYIPLWIFTATYFPHAWTPSAAILATWGWLRRRYRSSGLVARRDNG
jgi:hypothetical protein